MTSVCVDDWRVDGYRWYQNGTKLIPKQNPQVRKIHFVAVLPTGNDNRFKRHAYILLDAPENLLLLHYVGDETIQVDFPHGNSKLSRNFYRTCPSVLRGIADSKFKDLPGNIYKDSVSQNDCLPEYHSILKPRNLKQIRNLQHREQQKYRLTHDALYNLHELAYDLSDYVITIKTYPNLIVICGLQALSSELNNLLMADSELPQLLSYDTTFQLGDFYLSPLLFRHTLFSSSPVIPVLFLIHERKFQMCHEEFMHEVSKLVPNLAHGKKMIPLVTDDETSIYQVCYIISRIHKDLFLRVVLANFKSINKKCD